jgi:hypothetical protein
MIYAENAPAAPYREIVFLNACNPARPRESLSFEGVKVRVEPRGKKHLKARDTPMAISHARQASAFDDDAFLRLVWAVPSPD